MTPIIRISSLSFAYPDGTSALDDISLEIFEDECVGLVGPNGAGKTTLLLHLNGILSGNGKIVVDGLEVCRRSLSEIRQKVGIVFQDPEDQLFSPTVFDDIAFGPGTMGLSKTEILSRVRRALREADLEGLEAKPPHHLSFGQKKKAALASILSMHPKIIALDEPTSNMDPRGRRKFLQLIKGLRATKILSTHDMESVGELCSRVIVLDSGKLVADGNVRTILSDKVLMESHGLEVPFSVRGSR